MLPAGGCSSFGSSAGVCGCCGPCCVSCWELLLLLLEPLEPLLLVPEYWLPPLLDGGEMSLMSIG
ncbi:hypothetical protein, partial [Mycolicibacterium phlei]|uniref:hypothetical protein n=1 Tax=Mycolicibacterium phlei TaxID=1771 RepID=UPI0012FF63E8